ncbi:hypothetical protein NMY22_g15246 [Coprinellus aureogranulatus]|nr:hypothetical protein NMY22_g15246 [Coprinellus aureogranulatus]
MDYPEPHTLTATQVFAALGQLKLYLENLPPELPEPISPSTSKYAEFVNFNLDVDIFEKTGDDVATMGEQFERVFGFKARTTGDQIIPIEERGEAITAVHAVLIKYYKKYPRNNVLKKWIIDILKGVEKAFRIHGRPLPSQDPPVDSGEKQTPSKRPRSPASDSGSELEIVGPSSSEKGSRKKLWKPSQTGPGRHADELMGSCINRWVEETNEGKKKYTWTCIACGKQSASNPVRDRVFKHVKECRKFKKYDHDLHRRILNELAGESLGAQVKATSEAPAPETPSQASGSGGSGGSTGIERRLQSLPPGSQPTLNMAPFREAGKKLTKDKKELLKKTVDLYVLQFITALGLSPQIVDSFWFRQIVEALNPNYKPMTSDELIDRHIPAEAAHIRQETIKRLRQEKNLSLTFDGTTIRKPESIYTSHVTTPSRETYVLSFHHDNGAAEHHTMDWICERINGDIEEIGEGRMGSLCSDSTSVTLGSRVRVCEEKPSIFNFDDAIHAISKPIEGVTKLDEFKEPISVMKGVVKFFKKSTFSTLALREQRAAEGEKVMALQKVARTRFGTHYDAAQALIPQLSSIRALVNNKTVKFKDANIHRVFATRQAFHDFETALLEYVTIIEPLIRSLWSLEAAHANGSDVFLFWLASAASLKARLTQTNPELVRPEVAKKVVKVFNYRYHKFFQDNDFYFTAFMLDPRYNREDFLRETHEGGLRLVVPPQNVPGVRPAVNRVPFNAAYQRVKEFLKKMLKAMLDVAKRKPDESEPLLQEISPAQAVSELRDQLEAYWRGAGIWMYNAGLPSNDPLDWWETVAKNPKGRVLGMLACKIFSCLINSMPDERTNSTITWLNSAVRGSQNAETIQDHVMIRQWYTVHDPPPGYKEFIKNPPKGLMETKAGRRNPALRNTYKKEPYRPAVKFRQLDKRVLERVKTLLPAPKAIAHDPAPPPADVPNPVAAAPPASLHLREEEEESASESEDEAHNAVQNSAPAEPAGTSPLELANFLLDPLIDLNAKGLRDLLEDEDPDGREDEERSEHGGASSAVSSDWDDNPDWRWLMQVLQRTIIPIAAQRLMINLRKVDYMGSRPIASKLLFAPPPPGSEDDGEDDEHRRDQLEMNVERSNVRSCAGQGDPYGTESAVVNA